MFFCYCSLAHGGLFSLPKVWVFKLLPAVYIETLMIYSGETSSTKNRFRIYTCMIVDDI